MIALIPLFPLVGFLINAFFGRRLPKRVSGGLASLVMIASFVVAVLTVWQVAGLEVSNRAIEQTLYTWIQSDNLTIDLTFRVDPLASVMILVITGIGSLIHIYSTAYMHEETDSEFARFFSYLNLFAAFMLVLVLGSSFPVMFVGWEGVGLCSYLLIGFWFKKRSANDAGKNIAAIACTPPALKIFVTPQIFAAYKIAGLSEPSFDGGVQRMISVQPAITAGTANIKTVEKSGAEPPGI